MKFFNTKFIICAVFLLPALSSFAQDGYYEIEDKEKECVESIELLKNGTFVYINKGAWTTSKTQGRWKRRGESSVVLVSEYQVDSFTVNEKTNPIHKDKVYLIFGASSFNQGPKSYKTITINENATIGCEMMQDKILAEAELRNKILTRGTRTERDSASKAYSPVWFECKTENIDSLESITVEFDKQRLTYLPVNKGANELYLKLNLAPDPSYRYFKEETFAWDKKNLISGTNRKFKKKNKPE